MIFHADFLRNRFFSYFQHHTVRCVKSLNQKSIKLNKKANMRNIGGRTVFGLYTLSFESSKIKLRRRKKTLSRKIFPHIACVYNEKKCCVIISKLHENLYEIYSALHSMDFWRFRSRSLEFKIAGYYRHFYYIHMPKSFCVIFSTCFTFLKKISFWVSVLRRFWDEYRIQIVLLFAREGGCAVSLSRMQNQFQGCKMFFKVQFNAKQKFFVWGDETSIWLRHV